MDERSVYCHVLYALRYYFVNRPRIASRCKGLIRALSQIKPHRANQEIYDKDHEIVSHPLDALRYLLAGGVPGAGSQTVSWNADASGPFEALERAGRRNLMEDW